MNFWDFIWTTFLIFAFVVYLMILIAIFTDLFRDHKLHGGYKALWIIFLVVFPYLAAFVYLIARGRGMGERQQALLEKQQSATNAFIRESAGTSSPSAEIEKAKSLLDAGTITAEEYDKLKTRALA